MPIILGRENGFTMALDEVSARILVTRHDEQSGGDAMVMNVRLPETGLEIVRWCDPAVSEGAEVHELPRAPEPQAHRIWNRTA